MEGSTPTGGSESVEKLEKPIKKNKTQYRYLSLGRCWIPGRYGGCSIPGRYDAKIVRDFDEEAGVLSNQKMSWVYVKGYVRWYISG